MPADRIMRLHQESLASTAAVVVASRSLPIGFAVHTYRTTHWRLFAGRHAAMCSASALMQPRRQLGESGLPIQRQAPATRGISASLCFAFAAENCRCQVQMHTLYRIACWWRHCTGARNCQGQCHCTIVVPIKLLLLLRRHRQCD